MSEIKITDLSDERLRAIAEYDGKVTTEPATVFVAMARELQRRREAERANADNDGFTTRQMVAVGKALLKYLKPDATHADITAAAFNVCQAYRHSMRPLPAPPKGGDDAQS